MYSDFLTRVSKYTLTTCGILTCAVSSVVAQDKPAARPPNVVLILADDLGYAGVGVQGCKDVPTPNIDSIAKSGVRFTSFYVSCPVCAPTRAGLLTGRYQQRFGLEYNPGPEQGAPKGYGLPLEEKTIPERLKTAGYVTGMVGKWHLGYEDGRIPNDHGFDEWFGFRGGSNGYGIKHATPNLQRDGKPITQEGYLTETFADETCKFINKHADKPFFMYLAFNAVHTPLQASEKYLQRFADIQPQMRQKHAAMLSALDDAVGNVLKTLHDKNLDDNTIVVFMSDNGGPTLTNSSSNVPLRGYKGQMWEGGIRVPMMIRYPAKIEAGKVYDEPVISFDLAATFCKAANVAFDPKEIDGVDLLPFVTGKDNGKPHEQLTWRFGLQKAIRVNDYKMVVQRNQPDQLFNLKDDLSETKDLAAEQPEKLKELQQRLTKWESELMNPRWPRGDAPEPK